MSPHYYIRFCRPRLRRPLTAAVIILFVEFSFSLLITWPYHLNLASCILSVICATPSAFLTNSFLILQSRPESHFTLESWLDSDNYVTWKWRDSTFVTWLPTFMTWGDDFCLVLFNECMGSLALHAYIGLTYNFLKLWPYFVEVLSAAAQLYSSCLIPSTGPALHRDQLRTSSIYYFTTMHYDAILLQLKSRTESVLCILSMSL